MPSTLQEYDLDYATPAADWFCQLRALGNAIWLDSGRPKSTYGRYDILSASPQKTYRTTARGLTIQDLQTQSSEQIDNANIFDLLKSQLPECAPSHHPFTGGYLGYFGYDLGRQLEKIPETTQQLLKLPDMVLGLYAWAIIIDHEQHNSHLVINSNLCDEDLAQKLINIIVEKPSSSGTQTRATFRINSFSALTSKDDHLAAIAKIQNYIQAGDCYQVNLAQAFTTNYSGDCFQAYLQLRENLPSPFSCYFEFSEGAILSLSPERFIKVKQGTAETKPIKGTIQRGQTAEDDKAFAHRLLNNPKDRAENVMIVDLLRNDLSKTCTNVKVPTLCELQTFPNVHHLVSTITGTLRPEATALDVLAQAFPGGSITGAPKIRAMEIIEELEPLRRSVYCGSMGYISTCGNMDTSITIRTLVCDNKNMYCWGGGGIVADSVPEQEYNETLTKIDLLLNTLEQHFLSTPDND